MNIQVLPHIFKQIGLLLFMIGYVIPFLTGALIALFGLEDFHGILMQLNPWGSILNICALIGIIMYLISKEKVEDELMEKVRLESMSVAFLLSVFVLLFIIIVNYSSDYRVRAASMFYFQLILFLFIYHYKKRSFDL